MPPTDRTVYVVPSPAPTGPPCAPASTRVVADLPTVSINDQAEFAAEQREPIDQLLFIVYALLGLAVVIAVLGIVNTLALSVIERVREIGLLRAVGLSRRQLRTMLRLESVAIALLGAVLGIVLGLAFALALQRSLADDGIDVLAIPGAQLGAVRRSGRAGRRARRAVARAPGRPARRAPRHRHRLTRRHPRPGPPRRARIGGPGRDRARRARAAGGASGEHADGLRLGLGVLGARGPEHLTDGVERRSHLVLRAAPLPTTPWNWADAAPVQASWRPVSRAIMTPTCPSMSAEIRAMSPAAAAMRSVSTWNCAAMESPSSSAPPPRRRCCRA